MEGVVFLLSLCYTHVIGNAFSQFQRVSLHRPNFEQRIFQEVVNDTLDSMFETLKLYDPIHLDNASITVFGEKLTVLNAQAEGFSDVLLSHFSLTSLFNYNYLVVTLEAPKIVCSIDDGLFEYTSLPKSALTADSFNNELLLGKGSASLEGVKLMVSAKINLITLAVSDIKVTPQIDKAKIHGFDNGEIFNLSINDVLSYFLNVTLNDSEEVHEYLSRIVQDFLDSCIK